MELNGWIAAFFLFLGLELAFVPLTSLWFAIGALGGWIAALAGGELEGQLAVFVAVSFLALILIRPWAFWISRRRKVGGDCEDTAGFK